MTAPVDHAAVAEGATEALRVRVRRGDGVQDYAVPRRANQTVLDVVTEIQREQDPTLAYRFACRVGMCGSCGMTVNGRPRWTCRTRVAAVAPDSPERRAVDAGIECINCGVCYAACDVVAWNPDYLGPAALNRAWTLVNDVRDRGREARLEAVSGDAGCQSCHTHMSCTESCPKALAPTFAIAGLKRATARSALKRFGSRHFRRSA